MEFVAVREDIYLNLFRRLVHSKIFQIRRNIIKVEGTENTKVSVARQVLTGFRKTGLASFRKKICELSVGKTVRYIYTCIRVSVS